MEAPIDNPGRENWRDLVPHKAGRLILDYTCYKDYLVRLEREDGLPRIVVRRFGMARNMPSPLPKRPIRSECRTATNTTPKAYASPIRR